MSIGSKSQTTEVLPKCLCRVHCGDRFRDALSCQQEPAYYRFACVVCRWSHHIRECSQHPSTAPETPATHTPHPHRSLTAPRYAAPPPSATAGAFSCVWVAGRTTHHRPHPNTRVNSCVFGSACAWQLHRGVAASKSTTACMEVRNVFSAHRWPTSVRLPS